MSLIDKISKPFAAKALIAASRPEPTPLTNTFICLRPNFCILLIKESTTLVAAKGVAFLGPLKPIAPALSLATTSPPESVMVTIVLL